MDSDFDADTRFDPSVEPAIPNLDEVSTNTTTTPDDTPVITPETNPPPQKSPHLGISEPSSPPVSVWDAWRKDAVD